MATRLSYALPIAREFLLSNLRRIRPGGLAASLPPPSTDRTFVIVTGYGRSGTSAVARVLHESGVGMGSDFGPADEHNPTGYYEERTVYFANQQIRAGPPSRWRWRSTVLAIASRLAPELGEIARAETDGWKAPLFCLTLEAWLPHLPSRPKVIVCLRSPTAIVQSLGRISGQIDSKVYRLWARSYSRLLDVIRDYRLEATCVEYDELVRCPAEVVARLSAFIGRPLDAQYVEPNLRHHAYAVPQQYAALYDRVRALGPRAS